MLNLRLTAYISSLAVCVTAVGFGCSSSSGSDQPGGAAGAGGGAAGNGGSAGEGGAGGAGGAGGSGGSGGKAGAGGGAGSDGGTSGGHDFATAKNVPLTSTGVTGKLADANTGDYYKFTLAQPGAFLAYTTAQRLVANSTNLNDPTIVDTVISLYDSSHALIASDDDEWPRASTDSSLTTNLPAGDYFLKVEDCNAYLASNPSSGIGCAPASGIKKFDYNLKAFPIAPTAIAAGTTASTTPVSYQAGTTAGTYNSTLVTGTFSQAAEKHGFSLTIPTDLTVDAAARPRAWFWVQPTGTLNGDGSTANVKIWATSDAAGNNIIGMADQNNFTNGDDPNNGAQLFSFPLALTDPTTLDTTAQYYVWVENTDANTSAKSFYFIWNEVGSYYYGEAEATTAHGDTASAQSLTVPGTNEGTFFIDGTLSTAGEVDWYTFVIPATVTDSTSAQSAPDLVQMSCEAGREGSGLLGFSATLTDGTGTATAVTLTESNPAMVNLSIGADGKTSLPASLSAGGAAYLKIAATGQDATNPGSYYRCGVYFSSSK